MRNKHALLAAPAILHYPLIMTGPFANVLTGLIPDLYAALNQVSRELVGFIPAVARNFGGERAAVGESLVWPVAPAANAFNITPAMAIPEPTDQTIGNRSMTITKARGAEFGYTGEEQRGLNNGPGYLSVQAQQIAQALRTLTNEIEADLALGAARAASRAVAVADTSIFKSSVADSANLRKLLADNGAPMIDLAMVGGTTMGAALRSLLQLTKVNEAGTQLTLRQGALLDLNGFAIQESGQAITHTKGTNNGSAATNGSAYAVGSTVITLGSAGTGTIVPGDVITFAGDSNKYVVVSGDASVADGGTITIAQPGLRVAIPASATVITTNNSYSPVVGMAGGAYGLIARPPALPTEGDAAIDSMMLVDPRSGLTFEVRVYPGYRKVRFEITLAWGHGAIQPEWIGMVI